MTNKSRRKKQKKHGTVVLLTMPSSIVECCCSGTRRFQANSRANELPIDRYHRLSHSQPRHKPHIRTPICVAFAFPMYVLRCTNNNARRHESGSKNNVPCSATCCTVPCMLGWNSPRRKQDDDASTHNATPARQHMRTIAVNPAVLLLRSTRGRSMTRRAYSPGRRHDCALFG